MALRERAGTTRGALRSRGQLLPSYPRVRPTAAGSGASTEADGPGARPAPLDARVFLGPTRLRVSSERPQTGAAQGAGPLAGERRMKVLFLSTTMGMGGADQQLLTLADGLRSRGHEVKIASLTLLGPMGLEARAMGIPTESLGMQRGIPDPRGLIRLARLIRAWKPDLLHSHMYHANLLARVVRLVAPVPALVSTIHSINDGGRLRMAAYRLSNRLVDQMT